MSLGPQQEEAIAADRFLTAQLITCLGNKRALLPILDEQLQAIQRRLGGCYLRVADLFSGSGAVARLLKRYASLLVANDIERYAEIANLCHLANRSAVASLDLSEIIERAKERIESEWSPGFIADLYAPRDDEAIQPGERVFYTRRNAIYLDTASRVIDDLPANLRPFLLAPLIAAASRHANTSGVFKGFHKNGHGIGQFGGSGRDALKRILAPIELELPVLSDHETDVRVYRQEANRLAAELPELDVVYLDPPYNQHPYGSNYFMLNLLADYRPPANISRVSGVPTDWNRSAYNKRALAQESLFSLIDTVPTRYLLISYNAEGFISRAEMESKLRSIGRLDVLEIPYRTFRGSRNLRSRSLTVTEFLFVVERF